MSIAMIVDVPQLYHAAKENLGGNVAYAALVEKAAEQGGGQVYGTALVRRGPGQRKFLGSLKAIGIRYEIAGGDSRGPNWQNQMAQLILIAAQRSDTIVIVSGDDRLIPIIEFVVDAHQKNVVVMSPRATIHKDLLDVCKAGDDALATFVPIDESFIYSGATVESDEDEDED